MQDFSVVAVIPAHLASVRFPRKILHDFYGLPMIEHVRRRALLCKELSAVYVATCDEEIASTVESLGGDVIFTSSSHINGTSRVAEAVSNISCSHVLLLQGDEPLLLPKDVTSIVKSMMTAPDVHSWNATAPILSPNELDLHSFVKCLINSRGRIIQCFRRSPCYSDFKYQALFVRKILGLIAFRRDFLLSLQSLPPSLFDVHESIEQMKIIENEFSLFSVPVDVSLPSVNEPSDVDKIYTFVQNNVDQSRLLKSILAY